MSKFFNWLNKDKNKQDDPRHPEPKQTEPTQVESLPVKPTKIEPDEKISLQDAPMQRAPVQRAQTLEPHSTNNNAQTSSLTSALKQPERAAEDKKLDILEDTTHAQIDSPSQEQESQERDKGEIGGLESVGAAQAEQNFFSRLKRGLSRTTENIGQGIVGLFRGKHIDSDLYEELETQLLVADVGMSTTTKIVKGLTESADRKQLKDASSLLQILKQQLVEILTQVDKPLHIDSSKRPFVILMVGVNGVGKTTTIGKMAKKFQAEGKKVMLAAGDTFRAAAVEQLQVWGQRNNIPVVAQQTGADSASVIFDAFQSAKSKNIDVLIADTAGRLQNKDHLMEELKKVVRVMKKIDPDAPHEIMLTLDAGTGQNAISQAKLFNQAVGLTGLCLSKLDGTAKGGVIFALADQFSIPIRYIGIGEGIDDLRPFNGRDFVDALFSETISTRKQDNSKTHD
jgi:fused signal recognition particle receptor